MPVTDHPGPRGANAAHTWRWWLLAVALAGVVIRLVLAPGLGFQVDLELFGSWARRTHDVGFRDFYAPGVFADYPPGYLYVLWFLGALASAPGYLLLKLPAILADVGLALLVGELAVAMARPEPDRRGRFRVGAAAAILLNPAFIALSAVWGQVDAVPAVGVLGCLVLLLTGRRTPVRDGAAMVALAVAIAMKPQAAFLSPVLALLLVHRYLLDRRGEQRRRGLLELGGIALAALGTWSVSGIPFGLSPTGLVDFYASSSATYRVTSAWAFNLWGVVGFYRSDDGLFLVGIVLFAAATAAVLWRAHHALRAGGREVVIIVSSAMAVSTLAFALLTRMHERYLFPSLALLAPFVAVRALRRCYIALSALFLLNLWYPFAYFNLPRGKNGLHVEPVFDWLFGSVFVTDTIQKRLLSIAMLGACVGTSVLLVRLATPGAPSLAAMVPDLVQRRSRHWWPIAAVAAVCITNLVVLRGEVNHATNLNDSSLHLQMVRWASGQIERGRIPLDGWMPDFALGSAQFHHYQSLPHTITAYVAELLHADVTSTYLWVQYLLLALWPVAVYVAARAFGFSRGVSATAALLSPLIRSAPGYGFEDGSYVWRGYGVYSQLWGMWLLPLAIGCAWRTIAGRGRYAMAMAALAATIACHLLMGYLALLLVGMLALVSWSDLRLRVVRAAVVVAGALVTASWVLVPLLADRSYSAKSEFYEGSLFRDSFGARKVLGWLFTGRLFDDGRYPLLTVLAAIGVVVAVRHARRQHEARAMLLVAGVSLVLFFGRPTIGAVLNRLPGNEDLQVHRFIAGVHLAGLLLAAVGLVAVAGFVRAAGARFGTAPWAAPLGAAAVAVLAVVPAHRSRIDYVHVSATLIDRQILVDRSDGADLNRLLRVVRDRNDGRAYAGSRATWGDSYRVGFVPAYAALANEDVDGVGFTFRAISSLSSDIEARFDDTNPANYELLNVRYLVLPETVPPPVEATLLTSSGRHRLWLVGTTGYFQVADRIGVIDADRTNLGSANAAVLASDDARRGGYVGVAFDGSDAGPLTGDDATDPPGEVLEQRADLDGGSFSATVTARRDAVVVLKATFDPRWHATVDGEPADVVMMAPSLVGVDVAPGEHTIQLRYEPYGGYPLLLTLGAVVLLGAASAPRLQRRFTDRSRRPRSSSSSPPMASRSPREPGTRDSDPA